MYDEADDFTYAYATSDDDHFSEATTILDELDDIDELGAMSPDSYLAPDDDIEAANMESFLEDSSQEGTMNDDDDDVATPKGKLHITICQVRWYMYHLMWKLEENTVE